MTDNSGNDRRRDIDGRIDTLGTGTNGVSRRQGERVGNRSDDERRTNADEVGKEAALADDEEDETAADEEEDETPADNEADDGTEADDEQESDDGADDEAEADDEAPEADAADDEEAFVGDGTEDDEEPADSEGESVENRAEDVDERSALEVELDPFVRAYAGRRATELGEESLDEYIVGSVKGYLAGLLGGDVASPGTLEREVEVNADPIFGGLLDSIADEDESAADVIIEAIGETYDVPVEEGSLVVAGLRDHEALLNGVVANTSNDLDDVSEVVQAAVETRLIEEPAE